MLESVNIGDLEFGDPEPFEDEQGDESEEEIILSSGITRILNEEDCNKLTTDSACLAYLQPLLILAKAKVNTFCQMKECKEEIKIHQKFIGSALYLTWVCLFNFILSTHFL